jgi:hypothetical protein
MWPYPVHQIPSAQDKHHQEDRLQNPTSSRSGLQCCHVAIRLWWPLWLCLPERWAPIPPCGPTPTPQRWTLVTLHGSAHVPVIWGVAPVLLRATTLNTLYALCAVWHLVCPREYSRCINTICSDRDTKRKYQYMLSQQMLSYKPYYRGWHCITLWTGYHTGDRPTW